jgi:hypothetical protein
MGDVQHQRRSLIKVADHRGIIALCLESKLPTVTASRVDLSLRSLRTRWAPTPRRSVDRLTGRVSRRPFSIDLRSIPYLTCPASGLCFAKIPCALKIVRFPATMAASSRSSLHPRTPRICPGEPQRYTCIYKDGGTRTFSRRCVGSDQAARSYRWCSPPSRG